jgi:hypothetical protein
VSLIYVSKEKTGTSAVRPLKLDEMAQIENWPKGFIEVDPIGWAPNRVE